VVIGLLLFFAPAREAALPSGLSCGRWVPLVRRALAVRRDPALAANVAATFQIQGCESTCFALRVACHCCFLWWLV
jgi:hypothetical protein